MISEKRAQWRSFAGGELSEEMYGRVDLPRHSIGLKLCYNTIVTPQGALENRAGSKFIATTQDNAPAWLVPFVRSDGQGFLLEFGDETIRIVGGGNIVNDEPDPGDTFTVDSVDVWTPADGAPVVAAVFHTSAPHGFAPGAPIRFQGFTLTNPDQAGINKLAEYMNLTWYVFSTPTSQTFTIVDHWPVTSVTRNFDFEQGSEIRWTFSGAGSHRVDNTSPVHAGTYSAKIGWEDNPNAQQLTMLSESRLSVVPGQNVDLAAYVYGETLGDTAWVKLGVRWYTSGGAQISQEQGPQINTNDHEATWFQATLTAAAPSNAATCAPFLQFAWGDSRWTVDDVTVATGADPWFFFSGSPYFGLINGGTVSLSSNTGATVLAPSYTWSHIRFASFSQFVDDLVIAHKLYPPAKITRVSDNEWSFAALTFNNTLAAPANLAVSAEGTPGSPAITYTYVVTALDEDSAESVPSDPDSDDNTLRTLGNFNTIAWDAVATTFRYNVYKGVGSGSVHGYIGSASGLTFTDDNISPDFTHQPPDILADFNAAGEYPGTVCFHEQRMILAGTIDEPQAFWASGLPAFDYFKASTPPLDDQAFTYELLSQKAAPILHSLAGAELLFFTSGGVQRVIPIETEAFAPTTVAARNVASFGAHELAKPQEAGTNVLYPVERGAHLYELKPSEALTGYECNDLSIIAAHLIDNYDWVQTAMRRAPYPIWFGLRNDGRIIGVTYMPEQQVYAWHQHELPGAFVESIAVVPEGGVDSLYVIARRTILGSTVRYIERVEPRNFGTDQADAYFVDAGITYRGSATNEVTGLDHLEGEDVMVLADGRVLGPYTVDSGAISIDVLATVIHVGLAYESQIETLPLAYVNEAGFGVGIMKNISQIFLRVKKSLGFTAGVSFDDDDQRPLVDDAEEELGDVPSLRDDVHDITPVGTWSVDSTICVKQTQPLPFTLTGLAIDFVDAN